MSASSGARVLTLNLAHGRGTAFHQAFTSRRAIMRNLDEVAQVILGARADIVALQELDQPSLWSGGFDPPPLPGHRHRAAPHGARDPRQAPPAHLLRHRRPLPLADPGHASLPFRKNFLDTKGYMLAHVESPLGPLDVVSLHLDFKRAAERRAQLADVSAALERREDPARSLIVAGDFNTSHEARCGTLTGFVKRHGLFVPEGSFRTFPSRRPRAHLDHVLISACLEVVSTEVPPAAVSDHLPVLVELRPRSPQLILPESAAS
jgi:endonuclease/exonuclease/phosphatase family metal-dependent hydrolase